MVKYSGIHTENKQLSKLIMLIFSLLLSRELLTERCRTDNLMPSIPVLCLPPCGPQSSGAEHPHLSLSARKKWYNASLVSVFNIQSV